MMKELEEYYKNLIQDKESVILGKKWLYLIVNMFKVYLEEYGDVDYMILREPHKEPKEEPIPDNLFLLTLWLIKLPFNKLFKYIAPEHPKEFLVISLNNKYNIQIDVESLAFNIDELGYQSYLVYWKFIEPQAQKLLRAYKENDCG